MYYKEDELHLVKTESNKLFMETRGLLVEAESKRLEKQRRFLETGVLLSGGGGLRQGVLEKENVGKAAMMGIVTTCGRFLEVYLPKESIHGGNGSNAKRVAKNRKKEDSDAIARRVNHRARKQIRRIVNANDFRAMTTLTLAPPSESNNSRWETVPLDVQRDYKAVRRLFKMFVQRVNRKYWKRHRKERIFAKSKKSKKSVPYIAVFELHCSERTSVEKMNTWHIHLAHEASEEYKRLFEGCWKHGITDYQDFRVDKAGKPRDEEIVNPGAYIAEYIGKEGAQFGENELISCKRYTCARGVKKPRKEWIEYGSFTWQSEGVMNYGEKQYKQTYQKEHVVDGHVIGVTAYYMQLRDNVQ